MNERIRELADEAGLRFTQLMSNPMVPVVNGKETDLEKFAELIVQECMNVALDQKKWVEDQTAFDLRDQAWNKARIQQSQHIVDKIKQHFGVKE
jgi:hypothetical protein